jgi:hypothetical protein
VGVEARRQDAGVIEDEEITGVEMVREVSEEVILDAAGGAFDAQHTAGSAGCGWGLGDEVFGEVEVEVGDAHSC